MTFREKMQLDNPDMKVSHVFACGCPSGYGYETEEDAKGICSEMTCVECWGREMKEMNYPH